MAMGQLELIAEDLKAGRLVRPFNKAIKTGNAFWIVWPTDVSVDVMTRKLIDWVLLCAGQESEYAARG